MRGLPAALMRWPAIFVLSLIWLLGLLAGNVLRVPGSAALSAAEWARGEMRTLLASRTD